jgi:cytoskeletal protein RodZ
MADKNFGRIIEDRRHQLNLTQEMVAKKVGVKANYIGYLERGCAPQSKSRGTSFRRTQIGFAEPLSAREPTRALVAGKGKAATPAGPSLWQKFLQDETLQQNKDSSQEQEALAQLNQAEKAETMASVLKIVKALRKALPRNSIAPASTNGSTIAGGTHSSFSVRFRPWSSYGRGRR